jgi:hypothetical protein
MLEIWYPHDGRHPKSRNGRDGLVHGSIWMLFVRRKPKPSAEAPGFSLPSIFPCSQSTITQSAPALARILETLDPGIICQTPIDGPLLAWKACFSLLDWGIVVWVAMDVDDDGKRFGGKFEKDEWIERRQKNDDDTINFLRQRWLITVGVMSLASYLLSLESQHMEPWTAEPLCYH